MDHFFLTVAEAARLVRTRELSPVDLVDACIRRIEALDDQVNAFITFTPEVARAEAKRAQAEIAAGRYRGPLHGIPCALKDVIDAEGLLTSGHSKVGIGNIATRDATATSKLRAAGAILLGKVATHEMAFGGCFDLPWPPARNPWTCEHFTGGSSSGSAAAVAAGFLPFALGTDTGGSIRTPSSLCGVTGMKPSYGLVSRAGVITNSFSLDHVGPMAWTVEDCAIVLQAIAGPDGRDPTSVERPAVDYVAALDRDIRGLRIGVLRHFWEEDLPATDEVVNRMEEAIGVLKSLGAHVETARMRPIARIYDAKMVIAETELFAVHQRALVERIQDFGPEFVTRSIPACLFTSADYVQAQRQRRRFLDEMEDLYAKFDVLVTACPGPAPRLDSFRRGSEGGFVPGVIGAGIDFWKRPSMTTPFNMTGGPAIAVCTGFSKEGLPMAMQVAARPYADAMALRVAHAFQRATPWREKRPALVPGRALTPIPPAIASTSLPDIDADVRRSVEATVRRFGLGLTDLQFAQLCMAAPYAWAMADRASQGLAWSDEPSTIAVVR